MTSPENYRGPTEAQITECVNDLLSLYHYTDEREISIIRKVIEKGFISRKAIDNALYDAKWKAENRNKVSNYHNADTSLGMVISLIITEEAPEKMKHRV